jgi:phosphate acetyltransferase
MTLLQSFVNQAKKSQKKIVLPETMDDRIIEAAKKLVADDVVHVVLVGDRPRLEYKLSAHLGGITIYDPLRDADLTKELSHLYYERRKHKGIDFEEAKRTVQSKPSFFAALLVQKGLADGMVAGAVCTTGETIKAIIHCVGVSKESSLISSFFIMMTQQQEVGNNGVLFFADCAVNPNPHPSQLADIASDTAKYYEAIMKEDPKVAFLSFSTKGSAKHPLVSKVQETVKIAKQKMPDMLVDGELQLDAAILPDIAAKKAPDSPLSGRANCLIFPDLQSANIGYKLTERLGGALAIGPIIQGSAKPVNDLSRGCSVDDIYYVSAITALQVK